MDSILLVIDQEKKFFQGVKSSLKEIKPNAQGNPEVEFIYNGALKAYQSGFRAYKAFRKRLMQASNPKDKTFFVLSLLKTYKLPSQIFQTIWDRQVFVMIEMIENTARSGEIDPQEVDRFITLVLALQHPEQEKEGPNLIAPVLSGFAGYYLGKKINEKKKASKANG